MATLVKVLRAGCVVSSSSSNGEFVGAPGLATCPEDDNIDAPTIIKPGGAAPAHAVTTRSGVSH